MAVPKLRFPEFTDDWEQRKLSEMATFSKGSGYSKADLAPSGKPIILYGRMYTKYETIIKDVDTFAEEKAGSVFSKGGEVIVPASGETAEDISRASVVENAGVLLGGDINIIHPSDNLIPGFLALTISNGNQQKKLSAKAQGASIVHLHNEDLKDVDILYPAIDEQRRISKFFQNLDEAITLHQRKLDDIKLLKKSMLLKMFPAEGRDVPEVRFPGFTAAWEQRKFGELTEIKSASRVHKDEWRPSGVPFYRSSDVMAAINGTENDKAYISEELYEKLSVASGKLEKGDVLVTGGGSVGNPYIVPNNEPLYTKDADLLWIKNSEGLDPYFVYEYFFTPVFRTYLGSISHVGTIAHYTITQLGDTPITLPSLEEQKKIGDFFQTLDNTITLHQRKCDDLQKLKKALLQQMFC